MLIQVMRVCYLHPTFVIPDPPNNVYNPTRAEFARILNNIHSDLLAHVEGIGEVDSNHSLVMVAMDSLVTIVVQLPVQLGSSLSCQRA